MKENIILNKSFEFA